MGLIQLDSWHTPATDYEERQVGDYRITRKRRYTKGYYELYGLKDAAMWQATKTLAITELQQLHGKRWKDWMVDDPPHQYAMEFYASQAHGNVLTAGLGLGLVHHELAKNPNVTKITAVERSPEVIELVGPYLPEKVGVVNASFEDVYRHAVVRNWDWIIVDLWVARNRAEGQQILWDAVLPLRLELDALFPDAKKVFHGFGGFINDVTWDISEETEDQIRHLR